ncbi:hypothetical protein F2Q69_00031647 [Brassica cretica]|uniref:Uncharacterized protein n=1 Tax=Brassica cretica TaxID=69181 RepID=A0A8S9S1W7_BRACR|nr:hypothetical protein F2Q69_00031647 [Brassica cretica]
MATTMILFLHVEYAWLSRGRGRLLMGLGLDRSHRTMTPINTKYEKKPNQFCVCDKCLRWEEEAEGTKNVNYVACDYSYGELTCHKLIF